MGARGSTLFLDRQFRARPSAIMPERVEAIIPASSCFFTLITIAWRKIGAPEYAFVPPLSAKQ